MKTLASGLLGIGLAALLPIAAQGSAFINFETAPVRPVALSPDRMTLAVCNLPDGRVELFDVSAGIPAHIGTVPVGIDPVAVQFRTTNELWIVNHISSTINIVDVARRRVVASLNTRPGPADIVFAGVPSRAFVSCSKVNAVQVFDPVARMAITDVAIDGERPKAMAISPAGDRVYVAIFESGNASTLLAPTFTRIGLRPEFSPVEHSNGPYAGQNPPPNQGTTFFPAINPAIPEGELPPPVSHVVKKNAAGRWLDDNAADWTDYISGEHAHLSGRVEGWDMPDHDLAVIDADTLETSYISGLMNICMSVAVNPASGRIAVIGTDATNERRFEPNLRATFLRVNIALIDHATFDKTIRDLNPHLDYVTRSLPQPERDKSIGDPRAILWNSAGTRGYVTGMGSRNLIVIGPSGERLRENPIDLGDGPTGMALDETRNRLYVLNRFSASVSVVDTLSDMLLTNVPFFDPTPAGIKAGRPHFYDTRDTSGLGHTACASCHVDGRMDRLAWDLGDPSAEFLTIINQTTFGDPMTRSYHPMKGPMVTQTLQDIIGHEPFHWRGDRESIEEFNPVFPNLQARDSELTDAEMQQFKEFLRSPHFPPNIYRNEDDTIPESVPLPGLYGAVDPDTPLVSGDPRRGRSIFFNSSGGDIQCHFCHILPAGLDEDFAMLRGPNGERHLRVRPDERTSGLGFKTPQLRNLAERLGLDYRRPSRAGFGFIHDGRVDTLTEFLFRGFPDPIHAFRTPDPNDEEAPLDIDRNIADVIAFLFCFSGTNPAINPVVPEDGVGSQDVATAVGRQLTVTNASAPAIARFLRLADSPSNRIDLVVRGASNGIPRGWYFAGNFLSDREGEELAPDALLALATPENPLTFTLAPRGSGRRIGIDRDNDGWPDRTELDLGFDPADPASRGPQTPPQLSLLTNVIGSHAGMTLSFSASALTAPPGQAVAFSMVPSVIGASLDSVTGHFQWPVPTNLPGRYKVRVYIRARNNVPPYLSDSAAIFLDAVPLRLLPLGRDRNNDLLIRWEAIVGLSYRVQYKTDLRQTNWTDWHFAVQASEDEPALWDLNPSGGPDQKYFRVTLEP